MKRAVNMIYSFYLIVEDELLDPGLVSEGEGVPAAPRDQNQVRPGLVLTQNIL